MSDIKLFQNQQIRSHWDANQEQWLFSVIDVVQGLTLSERPRKYWSDLKKKLKSEGSELSDRIGQLNMLAEATTSEISKEKKPETLNQNKSVARQGGEVAGNARKDFEDKTGKKVVTSENAKQLGRMKQRELPGS